MRIIIAFSILIVAVIKLCLGLLVALYRQESVSIYSQSLLGQGKRPIEVRIFKASNKPLANVDLWFHYVKGDFNLIGPKALPAHEAQALTKDEHIRFQVAPGLITPYDVKRSSGIALENERACAIDFAENAGLARRAQVLMAAMFQRVIGNNAKGLLETDSFNLFDVQLDNMTMKSALDAIMHRVTHRHSSNCAGQFSFVNADCVNKYVKDSMYRQVLNSSERVFADGIGVRIAARWYQTQLKDNVNGTDLFPLLCERLADKQTKVFLFGGRTEVVQKVAAKMAREFPGLNVVGILDGFSHSESPELVTKMINESQAELVFVALGAPLQEKWIDQNKALLNANAAIGVGGLFDFYSGSVSRAPEWVREFSMEWVWRLCAQPKDKAKRYLIGNSVFLARIVFSKVTHQQNAASMEVS